MVYAFCLESRHNGNCRHDCDGPGNNYTSAFLADKYLEVLETIARDKTLAEGTVDALKSAIADFKAQVQA